MKTARKTGYFSIFHVVHHVVDRGYIFFDNMIGFYPRNSYLCLFLLCHVPFKTYREKTSKSLIRRCRRLWSQINFILKFSD